MKAMAVLATALLSLVPGLGWASSDLNPSLVFHPVGYSAIGIFVVAYLLVMLEEKIHLAKSKPMLVAAGLIWILVA